MCSTSGSLQRVLKNSKPAQNVFCFDDVLFICTCRVANFEFVLMESIGFPKYVNGKRPLNVMLWKGKGLFYSEIADYNRKRHSSDCGSCCASWAFCPIKMSKFTFPLSLSTLLNCLVIHDKMCEIWYWGSNQPPVLYIQFPSSHFA